MTTIDNPTDRRTKVNLGQGLFPLRLTPFEFFFLCDDQANYPGIIPIQVDATGSLDRLALEEAFEFSLRRHPLLMARIQNKGHSWPLWFADNPHSVQYADAKPPGDGAAPTNVPGVVLIIHECDQHVSFRFAFRHVAVDGLGAFQFISDLFVAYDHFCTGRAGPPPLRELNAEQLRDRDGYPLFLRSLTLCELIQIAKVHLPLSARQAARVSADNWPEGIDALKSANPTDFLVASLTKEETAALSGVAEKHDVMVNDLLIRDYFLLLADWNRGTSEERRQIRIMIPTNMRGRQTLRMPAANVFSYVFLSRYASASLDRQTLLGWVREEMGIIKRERPGLFYEGGVRLLCKWPKFVRWSLRRRWAFATAVFTNLGSSFDRMPLATIDQWKIAGDLQLRSGAGVGPIRADTRICFSAHSYSNQLSIGARCDPLTLTPSQQNALLASFMRFLRKTIELES